MAGIADRLAGKWRIIATGAWDKQHLDLCGPAFLEIDRRGRGEMAFGALDAAVDGGFTPTGIDFEWNDADEGDRVPGEGWANLREDGFLEGEIAYHNGNETTFIAAPWASFSGLLMPRTAALAKCFEASKDRSPDPSALLVAFIVEGINPVGREHRCTIAVLALQLHRAGPHMPFMV